MSASARRPGGPDPGARVGREVGSPRWRTLWAFLRHRRAAGTGDIPLLDPGRIEALDRRGHLVERRIELGGGAALEAERVQASDDEGF